MLAPGENPNVSIHRQKLDNGLTIVSEEKHDAPVVALQALITGTLKNLPTLQWEILE